ncbi:MAG: serine hydrolase [Bacteroidota bacterium]
MPKNFFNLALFLLCVSVNFAQKNMGDYAGEWIGTTHTTSAFDFTLTITKNDERLATFSLSNDQDILSKTIPFNPETLSIELTEKMGFSGKVNADDKSISGFMRLNQDLYPVQLKKNGNRYQGSWKLSVLHHLQPQTIRLTIQKVNADEEEYAAYPMFGTFWCMDFKKKQEAISFYDYKTGLDFSGILKPSTIELKASFGNYPITTISFKRWEAQKERKIADNHSLNDGWKTASKPLSFSQLENDVAQGVLEGTEGIIIAKEGEIVYETYFAGYHSETPHDMRSAGKSIGSAIIGLAVDDGIIENTDMKLYDHLPQAFQYTKDEEKSKITLQQLLTMSSGIGVGEGQYQDSDNWLKTVLESPLKQSPGTRTNYKSADPFLTGVYLNERLQIPLELYIQENLFTPLGINNYILNTDDEGIPYFGGGLYLTLRDMLKFGQVYLNKGTWNGKRILSEAWVNASFKKHTQLENVTDKNAYGYFWWHQTYEVNGKSVASVEARGNGGQYIFVLPELEIVVAITSGNYRKGQLLRQPEKILESYILPKLME